jgi:hypothetical protein
VDNAREKRRTQDEEYNFIPAMPLDGYADDVLQQKQD